MCFFDWPPRVPRTCRSPHLVRSLGNGNPLTLPDVKAPRARRVRLRSLLLAGRLSGAVGVEYPVHEFVPSANDPKLFFITGPRHYYKIPNNYIWSDI